MQAVTTDSSDDAHAPSTVYPPPPRSKWLQTRPAIVLERLPARLSSFVAGNGLLYASSSSARNPASSPPPQPFARSRSATTRRTYGQRSRIRWARVVSPVRVLPTIAAVRSRGRPSPPGKPASASAWSATSSASQWVRSVDRYVLPATMNRTRSNWYPSMTAAMVVSKWSGVAAFGE